MHPIIRKVPSRNLPAAAPSVPIRANRNNQHAHADSRAAGNSHRNEANNAPTNGTFPATEPPRLLVEQVARLSTNSIPTRRSRLAKEPAPTFAMDTRKNAVTCPFRWWSSSPRCRYFSRNHPGRSSWRLEPKHPGRDAYRRRCSTNAHYAHGYVRWRLHLGN